MGGEAGWGGGRWDAGVGSDTNLELAMNATTAGAFTPWPLANAAAQSLSPSEKLAAQI